MYRKIIESSTDRVKPNEIESEAIHEGSLAPNCFFEFFSHRMHLSSSVSSSSLVSSTTSSLRKPPMPWNKRLCCAISSSSSSSDEDGSNSSFHSFQPCNGNHSRNASYCSFVKGGYLSSSVNTVQYVVRKMFFGLLEPIFFQSS